MPDATEAQLLDATAIFEGDIAIVWMILQRLERSQSERVLKARRK
jgi:hypothetical protein